MQTLFKISLAVSIFFIFTVCIFADGDRLLFFQDFDQSLTPDWVIVDANHDSTTWHPRVIGGKANGPCVRYLSSPIVPGEDWLITPGIALNSGTSYKLSFKARVTSTALHQLDVFYGSAQTTDTMTSLIALFPPITNLDPLVYSASFTVPVTGTYYIGFHCFTPPNQLALFIDDVDVSIPETDLQVQLTMDKFFYNGTNIYSATEEKKCTAIITNNGLSSIRVNNYFIIADENDNFAVLSFLVTDPGGFPVEYEAKNRMGVPQESNFISLAPGESISKDFDLGCGVFNFSQIGTYTIRAVYKNLYQSQITPAWQGRITSAPVTIKIQ